jgi:hypothetical protein
VIAAGDRGDFKPAPAEDPEFVPPAVVQEKP